MAGSTRILVTHQTQYLPRADIILVLEAGRLVASGSYAQLTAQGVNLQHATSQTQQGEVLLQAAAQRQLPVLCPLSRWAER